MANRANSRLFLTFPQIQKLKKGKPEHMKFSKTQFENQKTEERGVLPIIGALAALAARALPLVVKGALARVATALKKIAGKAVRIRVDYYTRRDIFYF